MYGSGHKVWRALGAVLSVLPKTQRLLCLFLQPLGRQLTFLFYQMCCLGKLVLGGDENTDLTRPDIFISIL